MTSERIFVGVLRLSLIIPGARSLKDRRQAVRSLSDRLRHRFPVSVHELQGDGPPGRQTLVITTAGGDRGLIAAVLDRIRGRAASAASVVIGDADVDVFRWNPEPSWVTDATAESDVWTEDESDG